MANHTIELASDNPVEAGLALEQQLRMFNNRLAPGENYEPVAWYLTDPAGERRGGAFAYSRWSVLCVDILFIDSDLRGTGYGSALLECAERWGRSKGCREAYLETFQAEPFYRKHGYTELGRREDYPTGHDLIMMRKDL